MNTRFLQHKKDEKPSVPIGQKSRPSTPTHAPAWASQPLQTQLTVNETGDAYEQEADTLADQVMRMPEPLVQRCTCGGVPGPDGECASCRATRLSVQRKAAGSAKTAGDAPTSVHQTLSRGGQPLDGCTRQSMESRFGTDFGDVHVYTDSQAAQSAQDVNARAYTVGSNVVFGPGQYAPGTTSGDRLIAHELVHVVQQSEGKIDTLQRDETRSERRQRHQRELDRVLQQVQYTLGEINPQLSTGLFDWAISEDDARQVLRTLQRAEPEVLLRVVQAMRLSGQLRDLDANLSDEDQIQFAELQMRFDPNVGYIMPGDRIQLRVTINNQLEEDLSIEYDVRTDGVYLHFLDNPVPIDGMLPADAANVISRAYHNAQIFHQPFIQLMVTHRGSLYAPEHGATAGTFWFRSTFRVPHNSLFAQRRRKRLEFMSYVSGVRLSDSPQISAAMGHYLNWIDENAEAPAFLQRQPQNLWQWALSQAHRRPPELPIRPFLELAQRMQRRAEDQTGDERTRTINTLSRYLDWLDQNRENPQLAAIDPGEIWAQQAVTTFRLEVNRAGAQYLQDLQNRGPTPEERQAAEEHFESFYQMALRLWGFSSRRFPYRIPIPSEGRDILVHGDPATQAVLNEMAERILGYAVRHVVHDPDFVNISPESVALDLLEAGYQQRLDEAGTQRLDWEYVDRHELIGGRVLSSFGETIATGLLVVGLVGAAVGAGIITGGAAWVLMGGMATYAGVDSYLSRREEIERQNYEVPIPETMLHSAGDVVGLSQLIEGMTGERLGTNRRLTSMERSDQAGTGGASLALLLGGSKAFRSGEIQGRRFRLSRAGQTPPGPSGGVVEQYPPRPTIPSPQSEMGPITARLRRALPQELRMGFDDYVSEIVRNGAEPETVFSQMRDPERVVRRQAERRVQELREAMELEYARMRSQDNPLNPIMRNAERVGDVDVLYNRHRPPQHEIIQAQEIASQTGEAVRVFGDTARGIDYPGIDGTIGNPPRPLSLKSGTSEANPNWARWAAEEAFQASTTHGYTHVEVHIRMPGSTVAEVQSAWNARPTGQGQIAGRTIFDGSDTVARYVIQCSDGVWTLEPPLSQTVPPGVRVPTSGETDEE